MQKLKNEELNRLNVEDYKLAKKLPIVLVLDNIRSLNNIGSIFRTADAFCIERIYLCGITASPPHREIHKTALGATESVEWKYFESVDEAVLKLKRNDYQILAIEQTKNSVLLNKFKPAGTGKFALVFGNEVHGVDEKIITIADHCIEIPQKGTKHSFNVSVSVGIVWWYILINLSV